MLFHGNRVGVVLSLLFESSVVVILEAFLFQNVKK